MTGFQIKFTVSTTKLNKVIKAIQLHVFQLMHSAHLLSRTTLVLLMGNDQMAFRGISSSLAK